jgi:hypothetical protein
MGRKKLGPIGKGNSPQVRVWVGDKVVSYTPQDYWVFKKVKKRERNTIVQNGPDETIGNNE